jgi:hypothetical protein
MPRIVASQRFEFLSGAFFAVVLTDEDRALLIELSTQRGEVTHERTRARDR